MNSTIYTSRHILYIHHGLQQSTSARDTNFKGLQKHTLSAT